MIIGQDNPAFDKMTEEKDERTSMNFLSMRPRPFRMPVEVIPSIWLARRPMQSALPCYQARSTQTSRKKLKLNREPEERRRKQLANSGTSQAASGASCTTFRVTRLTPGDVNCGEVAFDGATLMGPFSSISRSSFE